MKKYFKNLLFILLDFFPAFFITWALYANVKKYLDYALCGQTKICNLDMVGCTPCQYNFNSGVFTLKQQYLFLYIGTVVIFFLIYFYLYQFTKKHF
jgi:hypothetical protein